jgi:broad specificity phosphatase PhoE
VQQLGARSRITPGLILAGAGLLAVTPVAASPPRTHPADIQFTAGGEDITLDFVRHGQSAEQGNDLSTVAPGAPLSTLGQEQAGAVAPVINQEFPGDIAGIYASGLIRTQETAAPLATLLGLPMTDLSGLNAVNGGVFEGMPKGPVEALLNGAAPASWVLGQLWVPALGSSDYNGMAFENRFSDAVQTMYDNTVADGDGKLTDVAFSHEGAISVWTLMNVKNPDFPLIINDELLKTGGLLSHTGQVVLQGSPTDGWTLISWDGHDVPQNPGLPTELFVDFRDLITAPQMAAFHVQEGFLDALGTGSLTPLVDAVQAGVESVGNAIVQFPQAVIDDILGALNDDTGAVGAASGHAATTLADALG